VPPLIRRVFGHVVFRNAAVLYIVQISSYVFPLISLPYLSRVLTTEKFGMVAFAQTFVWYFVLLTEYGFNLTATRAIAIHGQDREGVSRIFSAVLIAKTLLTLIGLVILLSIVGAVPQLRPYLALFLISFLSVVGNMLFPLWLYQGLQKMEHVAIRDFLAKLLALGALFLLVHSDRDYLLAAGAQSGGLLLAGLAGLITVPWQLKVHYRWPGWGAVREQLEAGWPVFISLIMAAFGNITNTFILGLRSPGAEVAYFSAIWRVISSLRSLVSPISGAVYPHVSQKASRSETDVIAFIRKYGLMIAAPFIAGGLLLVMGAPWLVPLFLGAKYRPAIIVLQLTSFSPALFAFQQIFSTYYMLACGYYKAWMRMIMVCMAVNFVVLVPALFLLRGSVALGSAQLATDVTAAALYCWFYFRQRRRLLAAAAEPDHASSL